MSHAYEIFISDAVLQELNAGDYPRKKEIMKFATRIPLLTKAQGLEQISEFYVENYVMLTPVLFEGRVIPATLGSACKSVVSFPRAAEAIIRLRNL